MDNKFKANDMVFWFDPDDNQSTGMYRIEKIHEQSEMALIQQDDGVSIIISEAEVPLHELKTLDETFVCKDCGSPMVEIKAWININTGSYEGDVEEPGEPENSWCPMCDEHREIITATEYFKTKKQ